MLAKTLLIYGNYLASDLSASVIYLKMHDLTVFCDRSAVLARRDCRWPLVAQKRMRQRAPRFAGKRPDTKSRSLEAELKALVGLVSDHMFKGDGLLNESLVNRAVKPRWSGKNLPLINRLKVDRKLFNEVSNCRLPPYLRRCTDRPEAWVGNFCGGW